MLEFLGQHDLPLRQDVSLPQQHLFARQRGLQFGRIPITLAHADSGGACSEKLKSGFECGAAHDHPSRVLVQKPWCFLRDARWEGLGVLSQRALHPD
jgi:hypothetical protein